VSDPLELPPLHEAVLDAAWLTRLEEDLVTCARIEAVVPRQRVRGHAAPASTTLREGFQGLRSGAILGLQVRYQHDGRAWCDTLMPHANGFRLVRIDQTAPIGPTCDADPS
jgi:hypothetical protein